MTELTNKENETVYALINSAMNFIAKCDYRDDNNFNDFIELIVIFFKAEYEYYNYSFDELIDAIKAKYNEK